MTTEIELGAELEKARIAYIKPTGSEEAHRLGLLPQNIDLPIGTKLYVLHASDGSVLGYASTSRWRPKAAYDTTVESSVYCRPDAVGRGVGTQLYTGLFEVLASEDVHRVVAGIGQPNAASVALHVDERGDAKEHEQAGANACPHRALLSKGGRIIAPAGARTRRRPSTGRTCGRRSRTHPLV